MFRSASLISLTLAISSKLWMLFLTLSIMAWNAAISPSGCTGTGGRAKGRGTHWHDKYSEQAASPTEANIEEIMWF